MLRIVLLILLFNSNFCHAQHKYDSLVYNFLDSIWRDCPIQRGFVLNLDSTQMDLYNNYSVFPRDTTVLDMKFGYIHDQSRIYFFQIISSDLQKFLSNPYKHAALKSFPEHTYFKLSYVFDGSKLRCYKTHDMLSGFRDEYHSFLESIVDYSFKGFNLPLVIRKEKRCVIKSD